MIDRYPYYGKPCKRQSDCAQCTLDGTCTCSPNPGQHPPFTGCCVPKQVQENSPPENNPAPSSLPSTVTITYEMYQGLPAMSKTVHVAAGTGCSTIRGLLVEKMAFQETQIGRNLHFDVDWGWFQGDRVSMFTSYARGPQFPCETGGCQGEGVRGCAGGEGVCRG